MKVVIVGGVAGGASAAARLRRLDEKAEIILFERGSEISYANCGLPYWVGGTITRREALTLQTPESFFERFRVDVRLRQEVTGIDPEGKKVAVRDLTDGRVYEETYDRLLLSPGASPVKPNISGVEEEGVFTLRNIPDAERIKTWLSQRKPESAVLVGGGAIGVEMAENLMQAGLAVTIVELADHLIGPLDYDMACEVERYVKGKGVGVTLKNAVREIRRAAKGLEVVTDRGILQTGMVLLSAGVRPDTGLARNAGLALNEKGAILVDAHMRTSHPDIYAVGDAVATPNLITGEKEAVALAGPANRQGRIAADNLCGYDSAYQGTQGSAIVKVFDMTVAVTGLNERAARAAGLDYDKVFTFSSSHAGYYPGAGNMTIKTVFERGSGKILGAQLVGFGGVDKRCDVLATAIRAGMTAFDLTELELCYAPPYSSAKDPVNMAGFVIENLLTGKLKQFHWHDVEALPRDGSVQLLDVRTAAEYRRGHIEGFQNIPLDELRERLSELDQSKALYVHCHSGLRSYIACRILSQNGFDCYNFSGSYRLYESIVEKREYDDALLLGCGAPAKTQEGV